MPYRTSCLAIAALAVAASSPVVLAADNHFVPVVSPEAPAASIAEASPAAGESSAPSAAPWAGKGGFPSGAPSGMTSIDSESSETSSSAAATASESGWTTWCPESTTIAVDSTTYEITEATIITFSNCPLSTNDPVAPAANSTVCFSFSLYDYWST
ncbi:hypothetical protein B0H66DRAFT_533006 [Apodospora peruviana]|uniref:Uncharacterized protein n=1 Tax=Apodospora peruviana TaxID=516989 RepID=A0AAE0I5D9_9PEZI|nr:hypothetical protein B0H66DRAFT_533006 [Apodospora peruviana]